MSPIRRLTNTRPGINRIAAGRLYQIARALGVDVSYFFEDVEPGTAINAGRGERFQQPMAAAIKFVTRLMDVWTIDADETARLLGFEGESELADLVAGVRQLDTRDVKDRIRHLMRIREALHSLFRDVNAEREWLREARPELQGQSPLALLLEGSMENLLTVSQFVQWMVGR